MRMMFWGILGMLAVSAPVGTAWARDPLGDLPGKGIIVESTSPKEDQAKGSEEEPPALARLSSSSHSPSRSSERAVSLSWREVWLHWLLSWLSLR